MRHAAVRVVFFSRTAIRIRNNVEFGNKTSQIGTQTY